MACLVEGAAAISSSSCSGRDPALRCRCFEQAMQVNMLDSLTSDNPLQLFANWKPQ